MNFCYVHSKIQIKQIIWLTYFALILSTVTVKHSWFSLKKSGRVYGTILARVSPSTLVTCFNICVKNFKCKIISFSRSSKICETSTDSVLHGDIRSNSEWETYGNYLHDSELVIIETSRCFKKQPFRGVLRKRCSENMQQMYMRAPTSKCDLLRNFIEIPLRHGCSSVNLLNIFRTPFPKNTPGGLLLYFDDIDICLGFLSQPFTNHRTAGEEGGHFFNSSLPLPPASQTLRY